MTPGQLLNVKEAAAYLGCGVSTLNKLRVSGGGPVFVKMHGRVMYKQDDLDRYVEKHRRRSTAEEGRAAA
jgi:excisionase family DNA binding protein